MCIRDSYNLAQRLFSRQARTWHPVDTALLKPLVISNITGNLSVVRSQQKNSYNVSLRPIPPLLINKTARLQTNKRFDCL